MAEKIYMVARTISHTKHDLHPILTRSQTTWATTCRQTARNWRSDGQSTSRTSLITCTNTWSPKGSVSIDIYLGTRANFTFHRAPDLSLKLASLLGKPLHRATKRWSLLCTYKQNRSKLVNWSEENGTELLDEGRRLFGTQNHFDNERTNIFSLRWLRGLSLFWTSKKISYIEEYFLEELSTCNLIHLLHMNTEKY